MVVCVAFEWCSMEELLCPENRSCGEATPQGTEAKDRSNFHLTSYDPFGSLHCNSHYVQTDIVQLFFLTVFCSLKIYFSAALMVFVEVLGNPFPLWISRGSSLSLSGQKKTSQSVLPCPGQDPAQYWDVTALLHVLFYPLAP